jgi:hypothetical protein
MITRSSRCFDMNNRLLAVSSPHAYSSLEACSFTDVSVVLYEDITIRNNSNAVIGILLCQGQIKISGDITDRSLHHTPMLGTEER